MQGIKRKRRCEIECKDHIFSIQSIKANSSKYDIKLLFCPKFQRQPLPPEQTFPQYNNDSKYYTSAFILGVDRRVLFKNQQQELMDHQKQMRDSLQKHNQLVFPRPNSKHTLCSVCKEHYKNYYFHISSEEHRQKISQSLYNTHIKNLCNIYIHLWQGAEQRADQEAEKRALEQQQRRQQRLAEMTVQQNDDEDQSLLDVQRGEDDNQNQYGEDDFFGNFNEKQNKKYNRNAFKDDQTIPFISKTSKRSAPQGRVHTSDYFRKKFLFNNPSQSKGFRERQQRRYQRERDKLKTERDNPEINKEFIKIAQKQGDTFVIMKAAFASSLAPPPLPTPNPSPTPTLTVTQPPTQTLPKTQTQTQTQGEFVWKRTTDKLRKDLQKAGEKERVELADKYQKQNKKYEIEYDEQQKYQKRGVEDEKQDKYDYRRYNYYPYPPISPYMVPPQYKHPPYKNGDYKTSEFKGNDEHKSNDTSKRMQSDKNMPPYYYNPYMYPSMYQPYSRNQKGYEIHDKQKGKPHEKQMQFPMHYPPWPYHNNPYFMPPVSIPPQNPEPVTSNSKSSGSTSININFPMYMCPPPSIPPRYPQPPYMGYNYPPYMPPQSGPMGRQNQNYLPPSNPNVNLHHGPPPMHSSSHIPLIHPPHGPSSVSNPPPTSADPYPGYPPYMPQYPQHYPYGQHKQGPPQHTNPVAK